MLILWIFQTSLISLIPTQIKLKMLLNSNQYLCHQFKNKIYPVSLLECLQSVPKNFHPTSKSFLYSNIGNNKTFIKQFQIQNKINSTNLSDKNINYFQTFNFFSQSDDLNQILTIDQIDGVYTTHAFTDEAVLFLNRAGDFYYFNLLNKNVFMAEKQHPSLYSDAYILTLEGYFLTCGGCVKNPITSLSERIIKVWKVNELQDTLQLQTRINTGHSKDIENPFILNNKVISLSCDKTIRVSNLSAQTVENVIQVSEDLFAGCNIDYNTIIVGGISKKLKIYDTRTSKAISRPVSIPRQLFQVTKIIRLNDNNLLLSNINELFSLDLRNMKLRQQTKYEEGQRISQITVINKQLLTIGNKEKTMQIWAGC